MDAEYLKSTVGETLASGLAAMVMNDPADPVDYLAKWLLNYVESVQTQEAEAKAIAEQQAKDEREAKIRLEKEEAELAEKTAAREAIDQKHTLVTQLLDEAEGFEHLFQNYAELIQECIGCSAVYVGKINDDKTQISYLAASPGQEFLLERKLEQKAADEDEEEGGDAAEPPGVTWKLFQEAPEEEPEEEELDDDGNPIPKEDTDAIPTINSVSVPNVLMGEDADKVFFFNFQNMGAYYAVRVNYEGTLNLETLDQAVQKMAESSENQSIDENEEDDTETRTVAESDAAASESEDHKSSKTEDDEEEETRRRVEAEAKAETEEFAFVQSLKLRPMEYCVCLDTLGQNRRFSPSEMDFINKYGLKMCKTLERIDRTFFKSERVAHAELLALNTTHKDKLENREQGDYEQELTEIAARLESNGQSNTETDVRFAYRKSTLVSVRKQLLAFRHFNVFRGPLSAAQSFFYLLDYPQSAVADDKNQPQWDKMRLLFDEKLLEKVKNYEPRDAQPRAEKDTITSMAAVQKLLEENNLDAVMNDNVVLAEMLGYVQDAMAVKQAKKEEEIARKEEEEEQKRLEAEAEAKSKEEEESSQDAESGEGDEASDED